MDAKQLTPYQENDLLYNSNYPQRKESQRQTSRNNILPMLLTMLTDNEPQKKQEAPLSNLISHHELRLHVLHDLQRLFNCINSESNNTLGDLPWVQRSTINYGIASLAGKCISGIEWKDIQYALTQSILNFEPRILRDGLQVSCVTNNSSLELYNVLSIEIKGRLWCKPHPLEFLFRTDMDLESGHFDLKDIG
ncbi:type VI secretion system baseplate subunit TssE [Yersinia bercovieri]|uniref:Type VI secretion system baseplate subunit TssE n=2 Tax=Yersinia bercovieri TaxID=634 RepID=A0A2G4TYM8_YERBE|nr:GPW/gp25 family protein [Yersinia bercovieri]EEQ07725.1 GPW/gp25 family protein [Yersinia bercovieri ATCC 43970]MCB5304124.1 GPW/gp25 family protein [Yersinia bercovieri]MDN0101414.1 GPW/gp25 family protein [Yersinia bercovieri]PHZ26084.1 type VI secretion system baseplate subunit TssE [Yersinia bercovieri]QKJ05935.1 GPW/gp25 family protein [Yersinia bercovieri ATCC 43970]